jgi:hypothetical protein
VPTYSLSALSVSGVRTLDRRIIGMMAILPVLVSTGCGALLLVGGAGTSAIAFATGELRATEEYSLTEIHGACQRAVETLGYKEIEATLEADRIFWKATTPGGDPVDIRLIARGPERTELRIRIGVFGNEARSRLVLEQIRQSL